MAVAVPAGDNEIVFKYHAYGQTAGIIFTIIGILLLVGYMIYFRFFAKKQPVPAQDNAAQDISAENVVPVKPVPVQDNEAQNIAADVIEQPPVSDTDSLPET
jgi:flagellar basal body-associated protein FliL